MNLVWVVSKALTKSLKLGNSVIVFFFRLKTLWTMTTLSRQVNVFTPHRRKKKVLAKSLSRARDWQGETSPRFFYRRQQKYRPKQPTDIKFVVSFTQTQYTREGAGVNASLELSI